MVIDIENITDAEFVLGSGYRRDTLALTVNNVAITIPIDLRAAKMLGDSLHENLDLDEFLSEVNQLAVFYELRELVGATYNMTTDERQKLYEELKEEFEG